MFVVGLPFDSVDVQPEAAANDADMAGDDVWMVAQT
jgi:hypothetical protein